VSAVLARLVYGSGRPHQAKTVQLNRLARRIAFNRVVAGVHFPIDSRAGHALGLQLAAHFVGVATDGDAPASFVLPVGDNDKQDLDEIGAPKAIASLKRGASSPMEPCFSPLLATMWRAAERELALLGY
jgi:hypothetical protein